MPHDGRGRIVLGVDGSLYGLAAVRFAVAHARATGMPLRGWVAPQWRDQTALHCLRHARCPVVVVPAPPLTGGLHIRRLVRQITQDLRKLS
jgi:nucleotide-binding universal stress UspA family protein